MTTIKLTVDFRPHAWESAEFIFGDPRIAGLLDEAHAAFPDFSGNGLTLATEMVVRILEAEYSGRYPETDWAAVRTDLSALVRKSLAADRDLSRT